MIQTIFAADNQGALTLHPVVGHKWPSYGTILWGFTCTKNWSDLHSLEYQGNGLTQFELRMLLRMFGQLRTNEIGNSIGISCRAAGFSLSVASFFGNNKTILEF